MKVFISHSSKDMNMVEILTQALNQSGHSVWVDSNNIPYGDNITLPKLNMVDKAEQFLLDMGITQVRVRHHGEIARIEVEPSERKIFLI